MGASAFEKWAAEFIIQECEIAESNLESSRNFHPQQKLTPIETVQAVYSDKLKRIYEKGDQGILHAYCESGNIGTSILLHRATVKEIFPIPSQKDFEQLIGISVEMLKNCLGDGLIIPLIQLPEQYKNIEFLHPILMNYNPACYEIRDKVIYRYLSDNHYNEYVEHGLNNKAIAVNASSLDFVEEYETFLPTSDQARWDLRYAQRYAALASLTDEDTVKKALEIDQFPPVNEENIKHVQDIFFDLHRKVIHPLTQGLVGLPYNHVPLTIAYDLSEINSRIESELFRTLERPLPEKPSMMQITKIHETDIPDRFAAIESDIVKQAANSLQLGKGIETAVDDVLGELMDQSNKIDKRMRTASTTIAFTSVGLGIAMAISNPMGSVIASSGIPLTAGAGAQAVAKIISHVFGKKYLPWQYWRLKRDINEAMV